MKKRNLIFITLMSFLLAAGFVACKRGFHHGGFDEFDLEAAVNRTASKLDLTDSQKADLKVISEEVAAKAKEMHMDRQARHQEMADIVRQETISRDTVDQMVEEKLDKIVEMTDFVADRMIAFHATLTPEQREKIAGYIEAHASGGCRFFRR